MTVSFKVENIQTGQRFRVDNATVVPELNMTPPVVTDKHLKENAV